jgi:hypothetical protein
MDRVSFVYRELTYFGIGDDKIGNGLGSRANPIVIVDK